MNSFCECLTEALCLKFNTDANFFVSKKKKIIHMSIKKPLIHYSFYKEIIFFIKKYWGDRKYFCQPYILCYPKLNQSIKWRFDYIIAFKKNYKTVKDMKNGCSIGQVLWRHQKFCKNRFKGYVIKVSELNSSFFVLLKRYRGKILGDRKIIWWFKSYYRRYL